MKSVPQRLSLIVSLCCLVVLAVSTPASANPITVPSSLNPGDSYRLAFLTSDFRDATSTDINDYNAFVDAVAELIPELAALNQDWRAIASTAAVDARDNTSTNPNTNGTGVPIFLLNDTLLANDNADLWDGSIINALRIDEDGNTADILTVWTGTSTAGTAMTALGAATPTTGSDVATGSPWITSSSASNEVLRPLYAISGILTIEAEEVLPEPGSLVLLSIGTMGLVAYGWRRRRKQADET